MNPLGLNLTKGRHVRVHKRQSIATFQTISAKVFKKLQLNKTPSLALNQRAALLGEMGELNGPQSGTFCVLAYGLPLGKPFRVVLALPNSAARALGSKVAAWALASKGLLRMAWLPEGGVPLFLIALMYLLSNPNLSMAF